MHFVITGGLGYIGSRIAERLVTERHQVTLLDNSTTSVVNTVHGTQLVQVDLRNLDAVEALDLAPANRFLHLAGPSSGPASAKDPVGTISAGYEATFNALHLAERLGVQQVINASSMTVYGDVAPEQNPVKETQPCLPISHYAVGKFANERLVEIFCRERGIAYNHLRMFNIYGEGQDLTRMDQGLVSIFVAMMLKSSEIVSRGSLARYRDVVHIDDVVSAWALCATGSATDGAFNLGSGTALNIRDMIDIIADELGIKDELSVEVAKGTPGDIFGIQADISGLKSATGFTPAFPPDVGIRRFTRWALQSYAKNWHRKDSGCDATGTSVIV